MEVTPATFREVEFREKRRGYHPEDVDQFLEQMAKGVEQLHDRLRQALERAQRAEAAAAEAGDSDETLRRTLVLAQRTAEAAVQDAREQASRLVTAAEQQAQSIVGEAEERARRLHGEALADVHAELAKLEATRAQAQEEVDTLSRWAHEHRAHLSGTLREALTVLDQAELPSPAPTSRPIDVKFAAPRQPGPAAITPAPAREMPPAGSDHAEAPAGETKAGGQPAAPQAEAGQEQPERERNPLTEPDEEALDNFFQDGEYSEEPRFGGRLRRRG